MEDNAFFACLEVPTVSPILPSPSQGSALALFDARNQIYAEKILYAIARNMKMHPLIQLFAKNRNDLPRRGIDPLQMRIPG
jgi:hypothetical protein